VRNRSISQKKEERKRKRDGELREKEGEIDAALSLANEDERTNKIYI